MRFKKKLVGLASVCLLCWPLQWVVAFNDVISEDGAIESVKIGDSDEKIFSTFKTRYHVSEETDPRQARTITLSRNKKTIATFSIDGEGHIFFIEVRSNYRTVENIGPGSTLSEAIGVYGNGTVSPTDTGYLVTFEKMQNISFLLNNNDIPKDLRNIPDDVFTQDQEKRILDLGKARIIAIQISG